MIRPIAVAMLLVATGLAQQPLQPQQFFVHDYTNVVAIDVAMVRKTGIWDELQSSALKFLQVEGEKELGYPVDDIDTFTMTMRFDKERLGKTVRMMVIEGNKKLTQSDRIDRSYDRQRYGDHELLVRKWGDNDAFVQPNEQLQVWGHRKVIETALDGERKAGLPNPNVMSLSVGKGRRLAYLVADLGSKQARRDFIDPLFEGTEWPAGDEPTFLAGRLFVTGDEDDPHVTLEITLRHDRVGDGIAVTDKAVDDSLERARQIKELMLMRKVLNSADKQLKGSDVIVKFDLGRARNAVGNLAMILAPMMMISRDVAVEAAQAAEVQRADREAKVEEQKEKQKQKQPAPEKEPKPAGGGGGGSRQ